MTAIDHDVATMGALYEAHGARLRQLCERRLGNTADAEDAAHEAMLKLWHALPGYDPSRPIWPWLAKIALNVCTDLQRRQTTARTRWVPPTASELPQPDEAAVARESERVVRDALGELHPSAATVLFLRDVEGWDYDRIGGHLERTSGAARVAVTRARSQLRTRVESLAKARGQWPLTGVLAGIWARTRRSADRAKAAVREVGARATGWLDPGAADLAGSAGSVMTHTVVGALVALGSMVLSGGADAPELTTPATGSISVDEQASGVVAGNGANAGVVQVDAAALPRSADAPELAGAIPAAPSLALQPASPTLGVDVPAQPDLGHDPVLDSPTVEEPAVRIAAPTLPMSGPALPEVVIEDLDSVVAPTAPTVSVP